MTLAVEWVIVGDNMKSTNQIRRNCLEITRTFSSWILVINIRKMVFKIILVCIKVWDLGVGLVYLSLMKRVALWKKY